MTATIWVAVAQVANLACTGAALALAGLLLARRKRQVPAALAQTAALALTACWALSTFALGASTPASVVLFSASQLAWLWMLYGLFAHDERDKSVGQVRSLIVALGFVELLQLTLVPVSYGAVEETLAAITRVQPMLRLLFSIGALVLVHNLYAGASAGAREALRWPAAALGLMWLYDLNLAAVAYLSENQPQGLAAMRGAVILAGVVMLALGALRQKRNLVFGPSRALAFRSFALFLIAGYLACLIMVAEALAYVGGDLARLVQAGFLALAAAVSLVVLPSPRMRAWLRVTVSKHLFQHRYDYRAEWLRFTGTMGGGGAPAASLGERVIQAVADITESPSGFLLVPGEKGLELEALWQWPTAEVPSPALTMDGARFFEETRFIVDLDERRRGVGLNVPDAACPRWLVDEDRAWAMVPLVHFDRLAGIVVLARPAIARGFDWEDFDLLRVVGRQLASYLAEKATQNALGEALRFDEFNRRIAFVMHDIKNLTSQLSLLVRNAEKHADNPEFRSDMLVTLRNSSEKLQALLARLGRYQARQDEALEPVAVDQVFSAVVRQFPGQNVVAIEPPCCEVLGNRAALEQALVHLVQNALDASASGSPVFLNCVVRDAHVVMEVTDSGAGMSPEFIRSRLFKPFHSSKPGGFGIGAYEARELVRSMGGRLEVESQEGIGSQFRLHLPRAGTGRLSRTAAMQLPEVA